MTVNRKLKQAIRARQAKTEERYNVARQHVLAANKRDRGVDVVKELAPTERDLKRKRRARDAGLMGRPGVVVTDSEEVDMRVGLAMIALLDPDLWRSHLELTRAVARKVFDRASDDAKFMKKIVKMKSLTEAEFERAHKILGWDPPVFVDGQLQPVTVGGKVIAGPTGTTVSKPLRRS